MNLEETIKRPDGSRVLIYVDLGVDYRDVYGSFYISVCAPGKRKFLRQEAYNLRDKDKCQYIYASKEEVKAVFDKLIAEINKKLITV